jgi:hypothetical protein
MEVDATRGRLRAGQGDRWREVLDAARLDRAAIPVAAMELYSQRFEHVRRLVEGFAPFGVRCPSMIALGELACDRPQR